MKDESDALRNKMYMNERVVQESEAKMRSMKKEYERIEIIFNDRGKELETWRDKYI